MHIRNGKLDSMSRPLGNFYFKGVSPPQNNAPIIEEQPIKMTAAGTHTSITVGATALVVS